MAVAVVLMLAGHPPYSYLVFPETCATGTFIDVSWTQGFGLTALSAFDTLESMR
jgi:hypothetical protein